MQCLSHGQARKACFDQAKLTSPFDLLQQMEVIHSVGCADLTVVSIAVNEVAAIQARSLGPGYDREMATSFTD